MKKVGIGFRKELEIGIFENKGSLDCLEIISDNYMGDYLDLKKMELEKLSNSFTIIPHGVSLSIGSTEKPSQKYLDDVLRIMECVSAPYYSEHFAITRCNGKDLGHLSPIWYTKCSLETVINNVNYVQDFLGVQLVLETITQPFDDIPCNDMDQSEFISQVCHETGCGILLDITNIYINATNFKKCPKLFIKQLPKDYIKQLHIVGYEQTDSGFLLDTHKNSIQSELWNLYDYVQSFCCPDYTIIERDQNLSNINEILDEVAHIRKTYIK